MKLLAASIGVILGIFGTASLVDKSPSSSQTVSDSLHMEVGPHLDSLGLLEFYSGKVSTPVCEGGKCYTIEILFYWDLIGRFSHFDTLPGKGLTKLDHIPFTEEDYRKLDAILRSPTSLLSTYSKEDLVSESRSSSIDGITGATRSELKQSIIEGAVYSCYTLWHIAQGPVVVDLQTITRDFFTKELIQKMVSRKDQGINYFLINHFSEEEFDLYLPEIIQTLDKSQGYYTKYVFEHMPVETIHRPEAMQLFSQHFTQFNYYAQVALLEKLQAELLSPSLKVVLADALEERDSYRNQLIKNLLSEE